MSSRKLRCVCEHVYMLAVCAFLLWDIAFMTEAAWIFPLHVFFPKLWLALAAGALVLSRGRLGAAYLPAALLAWMALVSGLRGEHVLLQERQAIFNGVLAFLVILPAPAVVKRERLMGYVRGLLAVWTAFLTLQAAVGLWAAMTGRAVMSLQNTWYIGVNNGDNRLYLNAYVTTGAVKMGLSVLLAGVGAAMCRKWPSRVLYGLCALVQLTCLSLTDCRTAFIAVGAMLGLTLAMIIWHAGRPVKMHRGRWLRRIGALALIPMTTIGVYMALSGTLTALSAHVPPAGERLPMTELPVYMLPHAEAEGTGVRHRDLDKNNLFNDRQVIWSASLRMLGSEPQYLLTGTGTEMSQLLTNAYIPEGMYTGQPFQHVHSIYLRTLVSWGLPGLLFLAAFLGRFLPAAARLMLRREASLSQRLLPLPALFALLCDTVDCFLRLSEGTPLLLFGCLFAGLSIAADEQTRVRARLAAVERATPEGTVEVIIPVYNAAPYLERAVQSALACPATRVILVDDGSTDGSGDLCDALAAECSRVRVIHQQNLGASAARNAGLTAATVEYVAFLDADDELLPGAIAGLMGCIGDAGAAQGLILREAPERMLPYREERLSGGEMLRCALSDPTRHLLCHGWLLRRSTLTERFNPALTMGEDGEWMLRTLLRTERAVLCNLPAYRYTLRADSQLRGGCADVNGAYMRTLASAEPALTSADMPREAALYRLTHLLLMLTHGDTEAALRLREQPPFAEDFRRVRLKGMSARIWTLRLLRRRAFGLVRLGVRIRRRQNGGSGAQR